MISPRLFNFVLSLWRLCVMCGLLRIVMQLSGLSRPQSRPCFNKNYVKKRPETVMIILILPFVPVFPPHLDMPVSVRVCRSNV